MDFFPSAGVNDAMKQTNTMDQGIKPIHPGMKVMGIAFTVKCNPGSIITCHQALSEVPRGSVIVVDGGSHPNEALFGGLMTMEAVQKGVKGIVVDGAVRDTSTIRELGLPVFSRFITPRVGSNKKLGTIGERIVCGGAIVNTGDLVIGDDDGVVVIPKDMVEDILKKTEEIEIEELAIAEQVKNGAHVADL